MAILNPGFEDADPVATGLPENWVIITVDAVLRAGFADGSAPEAGPLPYDSFEGGWQNDDYRLDGGVLGIDLLPAVFDDGQGVEDFEEGWDHGLIKLIGGTTALFLPGADPFENFEAGFDNDAYATDISGVTTVQALFDPSAKSAEDFEESYGVDGYLTSLGAPAGSFLDDFESVRASQPMSVDPVADDIFVTAHGLSVNDRVFFENTGGRLPAGLLLETPFFVVVLVGPNAFKVAPFVGASATDITDAGFGTHRLGYDPAVFWTEVGTL